MSCEFCEPECPDDFLEPHACRPLILSPETEVQIIADPADPWLVVRSQGQSRALRASVTHCPVCGRDLRVVVS